MKIAKKVAGFSATLCPKYSVLGNFKGGVSPLMWVRRGRSPLAVHTIWGFMCDYSIIFLTDIHEIEQFQFDS